MTTPADTLRKALAADGATVEVASNVPLLLEDPDAVYLVLEGTLDVFAVPVIDGEAGGPRDHLFSVVAGDLLFGMEPEWADEVGLLAVGHLGTRVLATTEARFRTAAEANAAAACVLIDRYVQNFAGAVSRRSTPRFDVLLNPGDEAELPRGADVGARRGTVWLQFDEGRLLFDGFFALAVGPEQGPLPLGAGGWACAESDMTVRTITATEALAEGSLWNGLSAFHRTALEWADVILEASRGRARDQLQARLDADRMASRRALTELAGVMDEGSAPLARSEGDHLFSVCRLVAEAQGVEIRAPKVPTTGVHPLFGIRAIMQSSSVGFRKVVLTHGWWEKDQGPLIAFLMEEKGEESEGGDDEPEGRIADIYPGGLDAQRVDDDPGEWDDENDDRRPVPVAVLTDKPGSYELVDLRDGSRRPVDEALAEEMGPFGVTLYRSLPARSLKIRDLWDFVKRGLWSDARIIIALGVAGSILGLLAPLLTGYLFDTVIPSANRMGLVQVFVALAVATLSGAAFELTRDLAVLRLHTRVGAELQLAVLDRLIRLPLPFYRRFSSGDLGDRAGGINAIGDSLNGAAISAVLSTVVSASSYVLLFYYSSMLALLATGILVVNIAFSVAMSWFALRYAREEQEAEGELSGLVLQLLDGISKLRVSGTESRAFARWAGAFRRKQQVGFKFGQFGNNVEVFNSFLSITSTLAIFWAYTVIARTPGAGITTGQFIAFNAAFGTFMAAALELTETGIGFLELVPVWERGKPILEAEPEVDLSMDDPGELTGHIEVSHLSFGYTRDGPTILSDVSIEARPGEFIAMVGPSGAGKSTLLRILLGFERAETNSVFIDGQDLSTLDIGSVRRQIGVVLQSSSLTAGDIFNNIVGESALTVNDAWEAARMAGLEDDLKAMPMGLHTVLSEGGGTLSGGQRQRLLIARALVHRPRILYFDEATSALDNRTQAIVSESIRSLKATRVVIAHRLSTVRDADRIYVMQAGKVVQAGPFDELMAQPGLFAELAARQEM